MPTAHWWKDFYAAERTLLGARRLEQILSEAPAISLPENGAIVFPHTRLSASGQMVAKAAMAVVESGCDLVLALGVLHGVDRARNDLRGIHFEDSFTKEEFSLDNFEAMLRLAARMAGKRMPSLLRAFPWTGVDHVDAMGLPGFEELASHVRAGAAIVATADMVHHGAGYGTPVESRLNRENPETLAWAKHEIEAQLESLARKDFSGFLSHCEIARSDFRDVGPVLAALLPSAVQHSVLDLTLVNYCDVLHAEEPTWVAAALVEYG